MAYYGRVFMKYRNYHLTISLNKIICDNKTCTINTLDFAKLVLFWAEANYYLQKNLNKNWDVHLQWIEQQWKLIEKYESISKEEH
jgi:hypothetical protein